ncbi:MAG: hypothetical protein VR69_16780 [Peptococcaceae bacterium BRH_c4b]|nr:MAG: hypothetical protein VR69_16780 [Peptococcaceae bacterium BRH_c4b]
MLNATLIVQIYNFLLLIVVIIVIPVLIFKLLFSRSTSFKNIEKIATELTEIRKLLEEKLK